MTGTAGADAVPLARREVGEGGTPLVIAHGLFGSARNWGVLSKRLSDRGRVVAVDMRNHGGSPHSNEAGYDAMAADLIAVLEDVGPADLLGHSMGGKAAMLAALARPDLARRLIVADIAPVSYGHSGEQRVLIDAMRSLDLGALGTRPEADAALAERIPEAPIRAFLLQSLDVREGCWSLNLDALDAAMDAITGWPDAAGTFDGPTIFLTGGASDYMTDTGRTEAKRLFPNAEFQAIPGAGHWLHAEKPREVEGAVRAFLG